MNNMKRDTPGAREVSIGAVFEPISCMPEYTGYHPYRIHPTDKTLHFHNVIEIGYCQGGSGVCEVDGVRKSFSEGDILIILPFQRHKNYSVADGDCVVRFGFVDPFLLERAVTDSSLGIVRLIEGTAIFGVVRKEDYPELHPLLKALSETVSGTGGKYRTDKLYYTLMLSLTVMADISERAEGAPRVKLPERISSVTASLDLINSYLSRGEIPTVERLAEESHSSLSSFRRSFSEVMSVSPKRYILDCMLQKACYLLLSSEMSIGEISALSGFDEISTFNRAFKSALGVSPRRYRELKGAVL